MHVVRLIAKALEQYGILLITYINQRKRRGSWSSQVGKTVTAIANSNSLPTTITISP